MFGFKYAAPQNDSTGAFRELECVTTVSPVMEAPSNNAQDPREPWWQELARAADHPAQPRATDAIGD